jgi:hypothetical protein
VFINHCPLSLFQGVALASAAADAAPVVLLVSKHSQLMVAVLAAVVQQWVCIWLAACAHVLRVAVLFRMLVRAS